MRYLVVTSFNSKEHWNTFARGTLSSFVDYLPDNCRIVAYTDGPILDELQTVLFSRVTHNNLEMLPEWQYFMEKFKSVREPQGIPDGHKFRFKFRPFFSKVCAIRDAWHRYRTQFDYFIWIDSDVLIQEEVSKEYLDSLRNFEIFEEDCYESHPVDLAWLDRPKDEAWGTPDTCFMMFSNNHYEVNQWIESVYQCYQSGLFLEMQEWHDAFIWQAMLKLYRDKLLVKNLGYNGYLTDPITASELHPKFIHMKGPLKFDPRVNPQLGQGRSSKATLEEARGYYEKMSKKRK
jgi:hypothetical protein